MKFIFVVKDPGVSEQVELGVETFDKTFDSKILLRVNRVRRLMLWYGFAKLVSFVLVVID